MTATLAFIVLALSSDAPPADAPPPDVAAPPRAATRLPSGLAMRVIARGTGRQHPKENDCVLLHYTMWRRDGTFLSGTRRSGQPQNQCLGVAYAGVAGALAAMVVGEQRRIWVPAALTVRPGDDDRRAPVDVTIDLQLLSINAAPPTPRHLTAPPQTARRLPSGLALEVLKKGRGEQRPLETSEVTLAFSGWTADGRIIESSLMAHRPAVFPMSGVIEGWREALRRMAVGDEVRVWIPRDLAYGAHPRRGQPKGDLVYELELLAIK